MYKINTKEFIKDIEGKPIEDNVGKTIGGILASAKPSPDPLRSWVLAQKFAQEETVEVNDADVKFIKDMIAISSNYYPFVLGQILGILEGLKGQEVDKK